MDKGFDLDIIVYGKKNSFSVKEDSFLHILKTIAMFVFILQEIC